MAFRRAWSPTLGRRKSPLGARPALQRKPEEKRLSPRAAFCASHSSCAAGPACTPAPRPLAPPSLPTPTSGRLSRDLSPSAPMASVRPARSGSGALCWQLLLTLTVSGRPAAGSREGGCARWGSQRKLWGQGWLGGWQAKRRVMGRRPVEQMELEEWGKVARKRFATWAPRSRKGGEGCHR